jgi:hypothetical protein
VYVCIRTCGIILANKSRNLCLLVYYVCVGVTIDIIDIYFVVAVTM